MYSYINIYKIIDKYYDKYMFISLSYKSWVYKFGKKIFL